jgi:DNA anti-recombination protein RmuC
MVHKQKHTEEAKQKISDKMQEVRNRMRDNDLKRLKELSPKYLQLKILEFISEFLIDRNKLILARLKEQCTN